MSSRNVLKVRAVLTRGRTSSSAITWALFERYLTEGAPKELQEEVQRGVQMARDGYRAAFGAIRPEIAEAVEESFAEILLEFFKSRYPGLWEEFCESRARKLH